MSFFLTTCPHCGMYYAHIYVGNSLLGSHVCKKKG